MVRSSGFGSVSSDCRPIQARFHSGSSIFYLNLPLLTSRRLILQQVRGQTFSRSPTACRLKLSCSFHSPSGVLFTFPSRYYFAIGHSVIFSLTRWSSPIHTEFHVLHATWDPIWLFRFSNTRLSLSMVEYSKLILLTLTFNQNDCPTTLKKFRLFPFRSPLLRESFLLSFPLDTKMFQFSRFALSYLCIQ